LASAFQAHPPVAVEENEEKAGSKIAKHDTGLETAQDRPRKRREQLSEDEEMRAAMEASLASAHAHALASMTHAGAAGDRGKQAADDDEEEEEVIGRRRQATSWKGRRILSDDEEESEEELKRKRANPGKGKRRILSDEEDEEEAARAARPAESSEEEESCGYKERAAQRLARQKKIKGIIRQIIREMMHSTEDAEMLDTNADKSLRKAWYEQFNDLMYNHFRSETVTVCEEFAEYIKRQIDERAEVLMDHGEHSQVFCKVSLSLSLSLCLPPFLSAHTEHTHAL